MKIDTFNVFFWVIVGLQVAMVVFAILSLAWIVHEAAAMDWSHGLSGVVNQLWCGAGACK